jgi:hypothetical protein
VLIQFPEIQDQILKEVLAIPQSNSLHPSVISSNWGTCWNTPHFSFATPKHHNRPSTFDTPSQTVWSPRSDKHGAFLEVRHVFQVLIDATILRTSTHFYRTGIDMLYGKNSFSFDMVDTAWRSSPPTLLPGDVLFRPQPYRPGGDDRGIAVNQAIPLMESQAPSDRLPGYIYYDHFLRFLHFIGPRNAAHLKTLEFSGAVKDHPCTEEHRHPSVEEFLDSMRFYIPFINKFCTGLEKLVLHACHDTFDSWRFAPPPPGDVEPVTHEQVMISFLENEARTISSLKVLEVSGTPDVSFAEPTIAWFKERTAQRMREAIEEQGKKELADSVRAQNLHCGFCGEGHVWAECHNLCNFCGGFGHFRKSCLVLS